MNNNKIIYIENQAYFVIKELLFEDCQYYLVDCLNQDLQPREEFHFVVESNEKEDLNSSYELVEDENLKETLAKIFLPLFN